MNIIVQNIMQEELGWLFHLELSYAIFVGPIISPLLTGNTVLVKSVSQTLEIAKVILASMHHVGVPDALRMCDPDIDEAPKAVKDERISGITFTGSHKSAKAIQRLIAERDGAIIPLIAETGGINCMIADSTCFSRTISTRRYTWCV